MRLIRHQQGAGIIELLIGVTVSMIVVAGAIAIFIDTSKSGADNLRNSRLNQELRPIATLMANDIRRAGFAGSIPGTDTNGDGTVDTADLAYNPFTAGNYDLAITGGNCISFSYNLDGSTDADEVGLPPLIGLGGAGAASATTDTDNNELFGYRLDTANQRIEMRQGGDTPGCANGVWQDISSPDVEITALTFAQATNTLPILDADDDGVCDSGDTCQDIRQINITITGQMSSGGTVVATQTVQASVKVRNPRFYVEP